MENLRKHSNSLLERAFFAVVSLVVIYYIILMPFFIGGFTRNAIIPGPQLIFANPIGSLIALLWVVFRWERVPKILCFVCLVISICVALPIGFNWYNTQSKQDSGVLLLAIVFPVTCFIIMPLVTVYSLNHFELVQKKLFNKK